MGEYLQSVFAQYWHAQDWRPTSRYSLAAWLVFYAGFLIYAFSKHGAFLFIDLANFGKNILTSSNLLSVSNCVCPQLTIFSRSKPPSCWHGES